MHSDDNNIRKVIALKLNDVMITSYIEALSKQQVYIYYNYIYIYIYIYNSCVNE